MNQGSVFGGCSLFQTLQIRSSTGLHTKLCILDTFDKRGRHSAGSLSLSNDNSTALYNLKSTVLKSERELVYQQTDACLQDQDQFDSRGLKGEEGGSKGGKKGKREREKGKGKEGKEMEEGKKESREKDFSVLTMEGNQLVCRWTTKFL